MNYYSEIGMALKLERTRQRMTLDVLANKAFISKSYISEIECGKKEPSLVFLDQLCKTLGLDLGEVLSNSIRSVKEKVNA